MTHYSEMSAPVEITSPRILHLNSRGGRDWTAVFIITTDRTGEQIITEHRAGFNSRGFYALLDWLIDVTNCETLLRHILKEM